MAATTGVEEAQAHLCQTFFAMAGAPNDTTAGEQADQALWALDALLQNHPAPHTQ